MPDPLFGGAPDVLDRFLVDGVVSQGLQHPDHAVGAGDGASHTGLAVLNVQIGPGVEEERISTRGPEALPSLDFGQGPERGRREDDPIHPVLVGVEVLYPGAIRRKGGLLRQLAKGPGDPLPPAPQVARPLVLGRRRMVPEEAMQEFVLFVPVSPDLVQVGLEGVGHGRSAVQRARVRWRGRRVQIAG